MKKKASDGQRDEGEGGMGGGGSGWWRCSKSGPSFVRGHHEPKCITGLGLILLLVVVGRDGDVLSLLPLLL